jgi:hypothetical protein|tara:strand:- start:955 stop:1143 length:189 start_codon:yes stop_codon:yes gene_type:complete
MSKTKTSPKAELINELIQLSQIRDEYWSFHPANPHSVDVNIEIIKIDKAMEELQHQISLLDK